MKKIAIIIGFTVLCLPIISFGQLKYTTINYTISPPMGDTKDYIGDTSFRGFGFETGQFINDRVALGLGVAWNIFNENIVGESLQSGNTTISGKQFRYINSWPIYFNTSYYFNDEESKVKTYAGLGVGTIYKNQRTEVGLFGIEDKQWHFALFPHAGILYAMGPDTNLNLDLRYHHAFSAGDSDAVSYLAVNIGLHFIFF